MEKEAPPSCRTYPGDIFILALSDHGNESGPATWSPEAPSWQIQLQSRLSGQAWEGSGVTARGQVTLSHGSSSVLQTREATPPGRTGSSICQQAPAAPRKQDGGWRVSLPVDKDVKERELSSNQAAPPGSALLTWWTDCLFTLSMNMKRPSRFNPALLSFSTHPILERIFVAGSRGWAYRPTRMNIVILQMRLGFRPWLTGHQKRSNQDPRTTKNITK